MTPVQQSLVIRNAIIFDGRSEDLAEGDVYCSDGLIREVGRYRGAADREVDAGGRVLIPGLIDAHFHAFAISLTMARIESAPASYLALAAAARLKAALRRGFTTVRDVAGGDPGIAGALAQGLVVGPRYLYTGAALSQTGGHGDPRAATDDETYHDGCMTQVVDGVDDLRRAVRDRFRRGAHAIKLMVSGGVVSPTDPIRVPQYSAEEIRAVCQEAHRRGSYVAAHAYSPQAIAHAVGAGVRSIEHGNLLDAETAALMAANGAFLIPTLATYHAMHRRGAELGLGAVSARKNSEVLEHGRRAIELARSAGVRVGFGTDLMGELEDEQSRGLALQAEVVGVLETLRSATSVNAELLGRPEIGWVADDAPADLVVLDGNPFDRAAVLSAPPSWVISGGRVVSATQ